MFFIPALYFSLFCILEALLRIELGAHKIPVKLVDSLVLYVNSRKVYQCNLKGLGNEVQVSAGLGNISEKLSNTDENKHFILNIV